MNRQPLRILSIVLFPLVATVVGCAEQDSIDLADESTETGGEDGSSRPDSSPPNVQISLDGQASLMVRSAGELRFQAAATDPSGIDAVEFYLDDALISTDEIQPYTASLMIPDATFNGNRSVIARAYDMNGNMAESVLELSFALPVSGAVEWEYIGPGTGPRWVMAGPDGSATVVGKRDMMRISSEGTLLSRYEFNYYVSAVTMGEDGGLIALGAIDETLVIQRFSSDGVPLFLDIIDDFGGPGPVVAMDDVVLTEDNRLVISSVTDTARISSVQYGDEVELEWHHDIRRDAQPTAADRAVHVAVAPSGAIYTTPTFDVGSQHVYLQLRRIEASGASGPISEYLVNYRWSYDDVVATDEAAFVAGRLNDLAVIARVGADGIPSGLFYTEADVITELEPMGEDLVYAAMITDVGTKLGRISTDGAERWTTQLGGDDVVHDIAVASTGHMYVVSVWDQEAWRLRRVHP